MRHILISAFLLVLLLISCAEKKDPHVAQQAQSIEEVVEVPNTLIDLALLDYDNNTSLWTMGDSLYSGYAVSYYPDSTLKEKIGILHGKKEGQTTRWYAGGQLKHAADYHKGKLHGEKKTWSSDAQPILLSHLSYRKGKAHGEQRVWYPSGELFKKLHLNMGKEEGIQQAFRKNGDLYANYEAREGRIFGLKKAALCFGIEDENVQYAN